MSVKSSLCLLRLSMLCGMLFGLVLPASAQEPLSGVVTSSDGQSALPYVNIGIKRKNIGTMSQWDGEFSLVIPAANSNDTLTFSMVGFEELNVPVLRIQQEDLHTFQLKEKATLMSPVAISAAKWVERSYGLKNDKALLHFSDGSTNQHDIFEIAQLIKLPNSISRITSLNLRVNESRRDSGTFRINFYRYANGRPAERAVEKSILKRMSIQEGWLRFDLSPYFIYLKGEVVVALEFIPNVTTTTPIYYEVKLGGSSRSFVRTSSQGEWSVPPHHYRMFVTAMVSDDKEIEEVEERATSPDTILYAPSVQDSFSIFIHRPKRYVESKHASYPVIYLLDANMYFDPLVQLMEERNVPAILVGIGYKDVLQMDSLRDRDDLYPPASDLKEFPVSGGANKFLEFIDQTLKPYINKTVLTDTIQQTIMGHSFGGYFVLYAFQEALRTGHPVFTHYVAASPSMDYADKHLLEQLQSLRADTIHPTHLYVSFGGREDTEDGGTGTAGADNFKELLKILSDPSFGNLQLESEIFPLYGHMETAIPTFRRAVLGVERY